MQLANIQLALGGDRDNTVYKGGQPPPRTPMRNQSGQYCVTAAEIPVLQMIHGSDSVFDVEPFGEWDISNREERARLALLYGRVEGNPPRPAPDCPVTALYPGAAARVFERISDLGLKPEMFKATSRVTADSPPAEITTQPKEQEDGDRQSAGKRRTRSGKSGGSEVGRTAASGSEGGGPVGQRASGGQGAVGDAGDRHGRAGFDGSAGRGDAFGDAGDSSVGFASADAAGQAEAFVPRQEEVDSDGIGPMPDVSPLFT